MCLVSYSSYGCSWKKETLFMGNAKYLQCLAMSEADDGLQNIGLRGQVFWKGEWLFKTHLAQPYPPLLAERPAKVIASSMKVPAGVQKTQLDNNVLQLIWNRAYEMCEWYRFAEDETNPYVSGGAGAAKSLTHEEHLQFMVGLEHPDELKVNTVHRDVEDAMAWEFSNDMKDVDNERMHALATIVQWAEELKPQSAKLQAEGHAGRWQATAPIHVALFKKLLLLSGWDAADVNKFCHCLIHGFPTMGLLDVGPYDVKVNEKKNPFLYKR